MLYFHCSLLAPVCHRLQSIWIQFRMWTGWCTLTTYCIPDAGIKFNLFEKKSTQCLLDTVKYWQCHFYCILVHFQSGPGLKSKCATYLHIFLSLSRVPHKSSSSLTWITGREMCALWCCDNKQLRLITLSRINAHTQRQTHSHGHAKLLQPLLFQLFGLEEEFKAALALVVSEVESVGPLQQERKHTHFRPRNKMMAYQYTESLTERQMEQEGAGAGGDRMQGDRWRQRDAKWKRNASGRANTMAGGMEGSRTDRQRQNREEEHEGEEEECEVAVPYNCWAADSMHRPK